MDVVCLTNNYAFPISLLDSCEDVLPVVNVALPCIAFGLVLHGVNLFFVAAPITFFASSLILATTLLFYATYSQTVNIPREKLSGSYHVEVTGPVTRRITDLEDRHCLQIEGDEGWLFNEVVALYFHLLAGLESKKERYPVQVINNELFEMSNDGIFSECDLKYAEVLFIPRLVKSMFSEEKNHFTLVAVDLGKGEIHYFDPSGDVDPEIESFLDDLEEELHKIQHCFHIEKEYTRIYRTKGASSLPVQGPEDTSCGFYICCYANHFLGERLPQTKVEITEHVRHFFSAMLNNASCRIAH